MKVKIKKEYLDKFRPEYSAFYDIEGEFDENQEYIVLGICVPLIYPFDERRGAYYLFMDVCLTLSSCDYFNVAESSIPSGWNVKNDDDYLYITFGEYNKEVYEFFFDYGYQYLKGAYEIEIKRYYELEVEEFFTKTDLEASQKQAMIEYYKSQSNREQWDKDVEFLSEYVIKCQEEICLVGSSLGTPLQGREA